MAILGTVCYFYNPGGAPTLFTNFLTDIGWA
jgi:hypothetical protein